MRDRHVQARLICVLRNCCIPNKRQPQEPTKGFMMHNKLKDWSELQALLVVVPKITICDHEAKWLPSERKTSRVKKRAIIAKSITVPA